VVLVTLAGRPRSERADRGHPRRDFPGQAPEYGFEDLGEETLADVRNRGANQSVTVETHLSLISEAR
jgi:hypothetical protein